MTRGDEVCADKQTIRDMNYFNSYDQNQNI